MTHPADLPYSMSQSTRDALAREPSDHAKGYREGWNAAVNAAAEKCRVVRDSHDGTSDPAWCAADSCAVEIEDLKDGGKL